MWRDKSNHEATPRIDVPWNHFNNHYFTHLTSFSIDDFLSVVSSLTLVNDDLSEPQSRTPFSKGLGVFVLLCRWRNTDWENMAQILFTSRPRLCAIYGATLDLLMLHYRICVRTIDYLRVDPLLGAWSDTAHETCGSARDNLFVADGQSSRYYLILHPTKPHPPFR